MNENNNANANPNNEQEPIKPQGEEAPKNPEGQGAEAPKPDAPKPEAEAPKKRSVLRTCIWVGAIAVAVVAGCWGASKLMSRGEASADGGDVGTTGGDAV